jgi:hypothetical protein
LKSYFRGPGDGRTHPHIPASNLVWAVVLGDLLREASFLRLDCLVHSPVRAELGIQTKFGDDALAYCTARMDPETTRGVLPREKAQAARNSALLK